MRNNTFRTEFQAEKSATSIYHKDSMMFMGSCFAENIGEKLKKYKFDVQINPFGILFNPASIAQSLDMLSDDVFVFSQKDLHFYNEEWFSFFHHGKFSNADSDRCLETINNTLFSARNYLQNANYLILTLGSSVVYSYKGQVVANCHKFPQREFEKKLLNVNEIVHILLNSIQKIRAYNPNIHIIFTISPVRYIKDNMVENTQSKAHLVVAVHQLLQQIHNTHYFPAYEIMMDDLRDYRFYDMDMVHPSALAINYIWNIFSKTFFDKSTSTINEQVEDIIRAKNHRLKNPFSQESKAFKAKQMESIRHIQQMYPFLSFEEELNYFSQEKQ